MLRDSSFWAKENDSPLMGRNAGYVTPQNAPEICRRVKALLDLIPEDIKEDVRQAARNVQEKSGNEEMDRLFYQDAVRTFADEKFRQQEVTCLNTLYHNIHDYHQGLGFIVAFLLLFLEPAEVATICLYFDRKLLKGYIKTHNHDYLRDATVFERLLRARDPEFADHLAEYTVPGAYCSKWFIGMNLHVLPFEALIRWFEVFMSTGQNALFQYGLSVCFRNREYIMKQKETSKILEVLRFEKSVFADDKLRDPTLTDSVVDTERPGSYYLDIVEHSVDEIVHDDEIEKLRREIEAEMQQAEERRRLAEAEYSDEEIVFSDED